jgi:hypothetical protein
MIMENAHLVDMDGHERAPHEYKSTLFLLH